MSQVVRPSAQAAARPVAASRLGFGALLLTLAGVLLLTVTLAVMIGPVPLAPGMVWR
ncbi:MAG: iron ABC transporter permease, partial [Chloroflexales bacterium]|nr:iron ABC transporter permease [Chloroflexales bacterium]